MYRFSTLLRPGSLLLAALILSLLSVSSVAAAEKNVLSAKIDQAIDGRLKAEKVPASPLASDAEFLRRVYLDLHGVIPSAEKTRAFLDSKDANKRAKLIDELLADPQYGKHMADIWQPIMLPRNSDNRRLQPAPLVKWLEENFNSNKPWDKFVSDLVTAAGPQDKNGAVTYFLANSTVDKMTDSVTKLFLGVQLQCAQCHNHPFTSWKQTEYWGMAAFFMKVQPDNLNQAARNGNTPGITESTNARGRRQRLPESAKMVPAKFLQGAEPKMSNTEPYRPVLASWLTSSKNPYFAKAMTNRMWAHLFGRGLVNPVDDMHEVNQATHPELLKALAEGFTASQFDLKGLIRTICNSDAYQRTSKPVPGNDDVELTLYSRMPVKVLTPEQLYDSYNQLLRFGQAARPARAAGNNRLQGGPREQFIAFFQIDEGADPTEYQAGIPQALRMMNSPQFNTRTLVASATKDSKKPEEVIETLYLSTLSRRPTASEAARLVAVVQKGDARQVYEDIAWALLNCSEFTLNH